MRTRLLDLALPPRCGSCLAAGDWLCRGCRAGVVRLRAPLCARCGTELASAGEGCPCRNRLRHLVAIRSLAWYQGSLERAIHRFKYRGWRCLADPLSGLLSESLALGPPAAAMVVPVPLHPRRLRERGYNQSALLARRVAAVLALDCVEGRLDRTRPTPPQVGQDRLRRFLNMEGAFAWTGKPLLGQPVLLLDDVITTGATLEACATALRAAGAGPVSGLTLARVGL